MSKPPHPLSDRQDAAALLAWYEAMGVDAVLAEVAVDRLASRPPPVVAAMEKPETRSHREERTVDTDANRTPARAADLLRRAPSPAAVAPSEETTRAAHEIARAAKTLVELRTALEQFEGCNLRLTATQLVFADGNPEARVMMVGEAPGRDEDLQGLPFVGRSGQLLDRMLAAIGLDRNTVYIANVIPWRPPGNRDPAPHETAICLPFIKRQIELVDPDFLLLLGKASAHTLLDSSEGILRLRGRWRDYDTGSRTIRAMATLHPAYLLRQPLQKRLAWRDFQATMDALPKPAS
jgi:uracil-DNA glycosylase family 4